MEEEHVDGSNIDDINSSHESDVWDDQAFSGLSRYHLRRVKEYHSWEDVRGSFLQARIEEEAFCDESICIECYNNFAVCRCVDCGPRQLFCINCAKTIHEQRNVFHLLEIFKDGCFVALFVNHGVLTLDHQRNCPTAQAENIICIDEKGHQHLKRINFCNCEDAAVTLVKSNYGQDQLLDLRYHQHLFKTMKQFVLQQKPDNVCPLCPLQSETDTDMNVAIECMDGCFGLVRKRSAGANLLPARHNGTFFANQDDVDSFVDDNSKKAKQAPTDCDEFKSGEVSNML
ncbi:uncharacterized protein LOC114532053 [Dendronephthya gigantea]|uniref:uncharacterized protein LOC114532053 n=1 Tax=Dendronephthya gigantea TaxID=151771 RepID=UPI00106B4C07|nr:uncharacterized protein LOC114532053 [Dendronephthya gigantea]